MQHCFTAYEKKKQNLPIFRSTSLKLSMKSYVLAFPIFDLAGKRSRATQGHHSEVFVVLEYLMLHTNLQGHQSVGSAEDDLKIKAQPLYAFIQLYCCHTGHNHTNATCILT